MKKLINSTLLAGLVFTGLNMGAPRAQAAPISPVSYDMLNGETGSFTYWDDSYTGSGSTTTSLSALSGGLGDLTNGVIATQNWFNTPGPYVGWHSIDPVISFNFGGNVIINSVTFYVDDSNGTGTGGVAPPSSVTIGATNYAVTDPASGAPFGFTINGLNLNVATLNIQLFEGAAGYMMLSEIQFDGAAVTPTDVPEPMTLSLLGAGLMGLGWVRRRRA